MQRQGFSYARDGRLWLRQIARRTSERETNVECGGPGRFSWPEGRVSASRLRSRSPYSIPVSLSSVRCQQIKAPAARPVRALTASHRGSQKGQKPAKTTNVEKWGNRTTKRGGKQNRTRLTLGGGRVGAVVRGEELAEERLCMASGACGLALSPAICIRPMRCALDGLFRKHSERAPFELAQRHCPGLPPVFLCCSPFSVRFSRCLVRAETARHRRLSSGLCLAAPFTSFERIRSLHPFVVLRAINVFAHNVVIRIRDLCIFCLLLSFDL